MLRPHPIGRAPANAVELDALADIPAVAQFHVPRAVEVIRFQHLQLKRHGQTVAGEAIAVADKYFAALEDAANDQRLEAVKIAVSLSVAFGNPRLPCGHDLLVEPIDLGAC